MVPPPDRSEDGTSNGSEAIPGRESTGPPASMAANGHTGGLHASDIDIGTSSWGDHSLINHLATAPTNSGLLNRVPLSPESWTQHRDESMVSYDDQHVFDMESCPILPRTSTPCTGQVPYTPGISFSLPATPIKTTQANHSLADSRTRSLNETTRSDHDYATSSQEASQLPAISPGICTYDSVATAPENRSDYDLTYDWLGEDITIEHLHVEPTELTYEPSATAESTVTQSAIDLPALSRNSNASLANKNTSPARGTNALRNSNSSVTLTTTSRTREPPQTDWSVDPPNLDPDTCDVVYLIPPHLRSDPNPSSFEARKQLEKDLPQLITRAESVHSAMNKLMDMHLAAISRIADPNEQHSERLKFISDPLVKLHYEELATLLKSVNSKIQPSRTLTGQPAERVAQTPGPSRSMNNSRGRKATESYEGTYIITLKSKNVLPVDTVGYFNDAREHYNLHVDHTKKLGMDAEFHFRSKNDRDTALKALRDHKFLGRSVDELYEVECVAKSSHLIRTRVFGRRTFADLKFIHEGKLVTDDAVTVIQNMNKLWFHKVDDIIDVQLRNSTNPPGRFLQIFMTEAAHDRVRKGLKQGMKLDLKYAQLDVYVPISISNCYRCCDPGHDQSDCDGPLRCRFCPDSHTSKRPCPAKEGKVSVVCFRCRTFNLSLGPYDWHLEKPEAHHATHGDCPFYTELRKKVLRELTEAQSPAKRPRLR